MTDSQRPDLFRREEELREALLTLERAWAREHELRGEYQSMLHSLRKVLPADRGALLQTLAEGLRDMAGASHAFILGADAEGESLVTVAGTRADAIGARWRREGVILRALDGRPKLVFDARQLPEFQRQPFNRIDPVRSMLLVDMGLASSPVVVLCTHPETAYFRARQGQLLSEIRPIMRSALLSHQAQELERERRLAVEKAALLEHATDAMGLGLACLSPDDGVVYSSPQLAEMVERFGSVDDWYRQVLAASELPPKEQCDNCGGSHRRGVMRVALPEPAPSEDVRAAAASGDATLYFEIHFMGQAHRVVSEGEVMLVRDVTEERHARDALARSEAKLRQAQKLEAVGRLAGGVAHDFNNTLAIILGSTELVLRKLRDGPLDEAQCQQLTALLEQVTDATRDGAALVNQLLAFSRRQVHKPQILDLGDVVDRTVTMLKRLLPASVELAVIECSNLGVVRADAAQLTQVLLNLVINARDAFMEHGRVTIRTANVHVDAERAARQPDLSVGRYVMLSVEDDGAGIPSEILPQIFDPFFSTKQSGQGTGLGLASVYGIVKQSDGAIEVESTVGVGTTFSLFFPRIDPVTGDSSIRPRDDPSRFHILLVENNDALRDVTSASLSAFGYRVAVARTAEQALEMWEKSSDITLLVTDVHLHGSLGTELARRLRSEQPRLEVLFLSTFPGDAALVSTGDELLLKPFTADQLVERVRGALRRLHDEPGAASRGA